MAWKCAATSWKDPQSSGYPGKNTSTAVPGAGGLPLTVCGNSLGLVFRGEGEDEVEGGGMGGDDGEGEGNHRSGSSTPPPPPGPPPPL